MTTCVVPAIANRQLFDTEFPACTGVAG
jgi:hypothetical protein